MQSWIICNIFGQIDPSEIIIICLFGVTIINASCAA